MDEQHLENTGWWWSLLFKWFPMILGVAIGVPLWFVATVHGQGLLVVVNKSNPISTITVRELTYIYMGKKKFFKDGQKVVPLDLTQKKSLFYEGLLKKSLRMVNQYWTKIIFSGRGVPPREFRTIPPLLQFLRNDPRGLAYLPSGTNLKSLKVLKVFP